MRRLFVPGELAATMRITGPDAHHLMHVLRARCGQQLTVVDEAGAAARTEITGFTADRVELRLLERLTEQAESPVELVLAQCLRKGDKMDFIVQKAVELGAIRVIPLKSANCVVKYDGKKQAARQEKWQRIADEALKQCGRSRHLEVAPVMALDEWLPLQAADAAGAVFMCYEGEAQRPLRSYLQDMDCRRYTALIGPEGGFSPAEAEAAIQAGVQTVSLGPRILRAETAALAALTVLQYEKGDLGN